MNSQALQTRLHLLWTTRRSFVIATILFFFLVLATLAILLSRPQNDFSVLYVRDFRSNHQVHPVSAFRSPNDTSLYDLVQVINYGDKPLSLFAFSTRPKGNVSPQEVLISWASWIAASPYAITIPANTTWTLDPARETDNLPFVHGHTWLCCYYEPSGTPTLNKLPAAILPSTYSGTFRLIFVHSRITPAQYATPQLYRSQILSTLRQETDTTGKRYISLTALDLSPVTTLTAQQLQ